MVNIVDRNPYEQAFTPADQPMDQQEIDSLELILDPDVEDDELLLTEEQKRALQKMGVEVDQNQNPDFINPTKEHFRNLAEDMDEFELSSISQRVMEHYDSDLATRENHTKIIKRGLELLGLGFDGGNKSTPFEGACDVDHQLLLENTVKYHSKFSKSLLSPNGICDVKIIDPDVPDINARTNKYKQKLNYLLETKMLDFVEDHDRALFYLVVTGSMFKKTHYDPYTNLPVSEFVRLEDFVVSEVCSSLNRAPRYTQRIFRTQEELDRDISIGLYQEMDENSQPRRMDEDEVREAISKATGIYDIDPNLEVYELLEHMCYLDVEDEDFSSPYLITINKDTGQVLSIRRNWADNDNELRRALNPYTHYKLVPGFGFLGLGLIHLIGNTQRTLTAILRSLVDSAQFANLQGGFKKKGIKVPNNKGPVRPGEWRDLDLLGDTRIQDVVYPFPFKEPSQTLYQLLDFLGRQGQKFADNLEEVTGNAANYGKVGTTLALLEQSAEFFSSIFTRVFRSQKQELVKIASIAQDTLGPEFQNDFNQDGVIDISPVADPSYPTKAHRLALAQTKLQAAQQAPEVHNIREAYKEYYQAVGITPDSIKKLLPEPEQAQPSDPLTDIQKAMEGIPIKAFPGQDHDAHIQVKTAFLQDPMAGGSMLMQKAQGPIQANIQEHTLLKYTEQIQGTIQQIQQQNPNVPMEMAMMQAAQQVQQANAVLAQQGGELDPNMVLAKAEMLKAQVNAEELDFDKKIKTFESIIDAFEAESERLKIQNDKAKAERELEFKIKESKAQIETDLMEKFLETQNIQDTSQ